MMKLSPPKRLILCAGLIALTSLAGSLWLLPVAEAQQPLLAPPDCACAKPTRLDNASLVACTCGSMNCVSLVTSTGAGSALSCR